MDISVSVILIASELSFRFTHRQLHRAGFYWITILCKGHETDQLCARGTWSMNSLNIFPGHAQYNARSFRQWKRDMRVYRVQKRPLSHICGRRFVLNHVMVKVGCVGLHNGVPTNNSCMCAINGEWYPWCKYIIQLYRDIHISWFTYRMILDRKCQNYVYIKWEYWSTM